MVSRQSETEISLYLNGAYNLWPLVLEQKMSLSEQELTRKLNAIADPARRKILSALKERGANSIGKDVGLCATDIESRMQLSQPTISHHMSVLKKAGLIEATKLGLWVWYRRNEAAIRTLNRELKSKL